MPTVALTLFLFVSVYFTQIAILHASHWLQWLFSANWLTLAMLWLFLFWCFGE